MTDGNDVAELEPPEVVDDEISEPEQLEEPAEPVELEEMEEPAEPEELSEPEEPKEPEALEEPEELTEVSELAQPSDDSSIQSAATSVDRQIPRPDSGKKHALPFFIVIAAAIGFIGYTIISSNDSVEQSAWRQGTATDDRVGTASRLSIEFDEAEAVNNDGPAKPGIPEIGSGLDKTRNAGSEYAYSNNQVRDVSNRRSDPFQARSTQNYGGAYERAREMTQEEKLFELMKSSPLESGSSSNTSSGGGSGRYQSNNRDINPFVAYPSSVDQEALFNAMKPVPADNRNHNQQFQDRANNSELIRVSAQQMTNLEYLVPQGKFIHAVLQTAIDSQLPGNVLAKVTKDIYGMQGKKILIPRGSTIYGEHNSKVERGQTRIYVTWPRLRTPTGINVELGSAGADSLGRAGLSGHVNRHFWSRFGHSTLLSLIGAGVSNVGEADGSQMNASNAYREAMAQSFQESSSKSLQENIGIDDTIYKDQGSKIIIFVARDIDFTSVMKN